MCECLNILIRWRSSLPACNGDPNDQEVIYGGRYVLRTYDYTLADFSRLKEKLAGCVVEQDKHACICGETNESPCFRVSSVPYKASCHCRAH